MTNDTPRMGVGGPVIRWDSRGRLAWGEGGEIGQQHTREGRCRMRDAGCALLWGTRGSQARGEEEEDWCVSGATAEARPHV